MEERGKIVTLIKHGIIQLPALLFRQVVPQQNAFTFEDQCVTAEFWLVTMWTITERLDGRNNISSSIFSLPSAKHTTCTFVDEIDTAFKFNNQNYGYKGRDSYKATFTYKYFVLQSNVFIFNAFVALNVPHLFDWMSCVLDHLGPHPHTEILFTHQVYTPPHRSVTAWRHAAQTGCSLWCLLSLFCLR